MRPRVRTKTPRGTSDTAYHKGSLIIFTNKSIIARDGDGRREIKKKRARLASRKLRGSESSFRALVPRESDRGLSAGGRGGAGRFTRGVFRRVSGGALVVAHEVRVHLGRGASPLGDGPDHEALPAAAVAGGEDARDGGFKLPKLRLEVGPLVRLHPELLREVLLRAEEAHGEEDEVRLPHLLRPFHLVEGHAARVRVLDPLDLDRDDARHLARAVVFGNEPLREHLVRPRVLPVPVLRLLVAVIHAEDARPLRPLVPLRPRRGGLRHELEVGHRRAPVPQRRADAVRARVAAADDDDVLVLRVDVLAVGQVAVEQALGVGVEELHGEVHAAQLAVLHGQIAGLRRAAREDDGVRLRANLRDGRVALGADVRVRDERDPLGGQKVDAALHDLHLIRLHVRHAVHHQPADSVRALVHRHPVPGFVELVRGGEPRGPGADDGHLLARARSGGAGDDPALLEAAVDDRALDGLDRDGVLDDPERAAPLARRGAHAPGELGEVVRLVEAVERVPPPPLVHELVPLRNLVPEGTPRPGLVAERRAAVHAPRRLRREQRFRLLARVVPVYLFPVLQARLRVAVPQRLALVLHEAARLLGRLGPRRAHLQRKRVVRLGGVLLLRREGGDGLEPFERVRLRELRRLLLVLLRRLLRLDDALVVARVHLHERLLGGEPVPEDRRRHLRARALGVLAHQPVQERLVLRGHHGVEVDELGVAVLLKRALGVEDERDAAGHARGKVSPRGAQDHGDAARHVFAPVVADALDDGGGAGVAHAEALGGDAAEERVPARRAVQSDVSDNHRLLRLERGARGRLHDNLAAAEPLADVIVRVAGDGDADALASERAQGLARGPDEVHLDGAVREAVQAVRLRDLVRERRADGAVDVAHRALVRHLLAPLDRRTRGGDELVIQGVLEAVVLLGDVPDRGAGADARRGGEDLGEVDAVELRARAQDGLVRLEEVRAPDEVIHRGVPQLGHVRPEVLREQEEEVHDVVLVAGELLPELWVLRGDPHGARVLVALAHHDAPHRHQRRGAQAPLLGAEQRGDEQVAPRLELSVRLQHRASAQVVGDERLLRLREAELPGQARGLDPGPPRRARAAVVAGDEDVVRLALDDARGDGPDAVLGDELDADARARVAVLAVVDELREVLDGVDVVVGRWGDEPDAGGAHARLRDVALYLRPGELAALPGLGALRHLDLDLVRVAQVVRGDAEAPGGHLLDRTPLGVVRPIGLRHEALGVLPALAGVRFAPQAVHRARQGGVRLEGDGPVAHRAGAEPLDDVGRGLHLLERDRFPVALELEHAAEVASFVQLVRDRGVLPVLRGRVLAARRLEVLDRLRVVEVPLRRHPVLLPAPVVLARVPQRRRLRRALRRLLALGEAHRVQRDGVRLELLEPDALDAAYGALEARVDDVRVQPERLENLRALVRRQRADAHLREHLQHAVLDGVEVVLDEFVHGRGRVLPGRVRHEVVLPQPGDRVDGEVGAHAVRAEARERAEVMHVPRLRGLEQDRAPRALHLLHEVVVHGARGEEGAHRDALGAGGAIRQDDARDAVGDGGGGFVGEPLERVAQASLAGGSVVRRVQNPARPPAVVHALDRLHLRNGQQRGLEPEPVRVRLGGGHEVALGADHALQARHHRLADRIDRRVRDLREHLLEVLVRELRDLGHDRQRRVVTHRPERLRARADHREEDHVERLAREPGGAEGGQRADDPGLVARALTSGAATSPTASTTSSSSMTCSLTHFAYGCLFAICAFMSESCRIVPFSKSTSRMFPGLRRPFCATSASSTSTTPTSEAMTMRPDLVT